MEIIGKGKYAGMFSISQLNESQLDFFREVENIGAGHAATALASLIGQQIDLRVPDVKFYNYQEICTMLNGPETLVVSSLIEMSNDISGFILLIQNVSDAIDLSNTVIEAMGIQDEPSDDILSDMQRSVIMEISNILSGSYLSAISTLTGLTINASTPKLVIDMAGAIMNLPAAIYGDYGDVVLFLETEFKCKDKRIAGNFLLTPDVASFNTLMKSMGIV